MINVIAQKTEALAMSKLVRFALLGLIGLAVVCYVLFANMAVRTLASLEKAKQEISALNVEVSEMESKRLAAENSVNRSLAIRLGFVEVNHPTFIMKSSNQTALSFKTN